MNVLDRMIAAIAPEAGARRADARRRMAQAEAQADVISAGQEMIRGISERAPVKNSGYSHGAASRGRTWAVKWDSESGSAERDIEENRKLIRERSRDLAMNSPLGAAAVGSTRTNCIGSGLIPKPKIDYEFLGISKEEAADLQKTIKKEFDLWAGSSLCDNNDQNNFYELQQIAFLDWLRNGEEFVLIRYEEASPKMPYELRLKLVEADRISTEGSLDGEFDGCKKRLSNGNHVMNGVEITPSGKVAAYYISSSYPSETGSEQARWTRVQKRGEQTGNPNILHIFSGERADQYRGVPLLAPVVESIKQISRYSDAEVMAAVLNAMFSIFIQTETGNDVDGFSGVDDLGDGEDEDDRQILVGSGTVNFLKQGESVHAVEVQHPSGNFKDFMSAIACLIGAALEIAPEILLKQFSNNFSASKGAMNETWKAYRMRRKWFVQDFCQEVYELWFSEAVSKGRIYAPGFFNNPLARKAYTNCTWNGPAQGQLDPSKEVDAAVKRIGAGLSTREDECSAMNGTDFEDNVRTLQNENELLERANGGQGEKDREEQENGEENQY